MTDTREVHALVVDADGNAELRYVGSDLRSLKAIIGGWLEAIAPATDDYGDWHAYCDEEGKIKGLPVNHNATAIAYALGWPEGDTLRGPVVFLGRDAEDPHAEGDLPLRATGKIVRLFRAAQN